MGLAGTLGHIIERHGEGLAVFRRVVMQYALGIEKAVGEIDADFELFDELGAAELAHRLDDCLIVIVSAGEDRSEEHTSELQSLMRISYAVFCLKKKKNNNKHEYSHS